MKLPIVKTVIASCSVVVYFKKRKIYIDDKYYKLRILPKKTVNIYRKDLVNIVGIIASSSLVVSMGEKVYLIAKDQISQRKVTFEFKISEKLTPIDADKPEQIIPLVEVDPDSLISVADTSALKPQKQLPIRDIVWLVVAISIAYYLGQRIDASSALGTISNESLETLDKKQTIPMLTTELTWWEKLTLPDWMIKDISNEGTYGQITRPTIVPKKVEPIVDPHPRRFVVILFSILQRSNTENTKVPVWLYSPLLYIIQTVYKKFNK